MSHNHRSGISRRDLMQTGLLAGLGALVSRPLLAAGQAASPIMRTIPSSGEQLPVIGLGTTNFKPELYDNLVAVLKRMNELGCKVIDTAPLAGEVEEMLGRAMAQTGLQNKFFIETKFNAKGATFSGNRSGAPAASGAERPSATSEGGSNRPTGFSAADTVFGVDSFERSLRRLQTDKVDILMIHYLSSAEELMPVLIEQKKAGRARYIGLTSVTANQYEQVAEYMRRYPLDFVQIGYSIDARTAEKTLLPLAMQKGIAVMGATPFGGRYRQLMKKASGKELPSWTADFDAHTWAQVLLKYVVAHPAITCVVPNTTNAAHFEDNQKAGIGRLPNERQRRRLEEYWEKVVGSA